MTQDTVREQRSKELAEQLLNVQLNVKEYLKKERAESELKLDLELDLESKPKSKPKSELRREPKKTPSPSTPVSAKEIANIVFLGYFGKDLGIQKYLSKITPKALCAIILLKLYNNQDEKLSKLKGILIQTQLNPEDTVDLTDAGYDALLNIRSLEEIDANTQQEITDLINKKEKLSSNDIAVRLLAVSAFVTFVGVGVATLILSASIIASVVLFELLVVSLAVIALKHVISRFNTKISLRREVETLTVNDQTPSYEPKALKADQGTFENFTLLPEVCKSFALSEPVKPDSVVRSNATTVFKIGSEEFTSPAGVLSDSHGLPKLDINGRSIGLSSATSLTDIGSINMTSSFTLSDTENNSPLSSHRSRVTRLSCGDSRGGIKSFNTEDLSNLDNSLSSIKPSTLTSEGSLNSLTDISSIHTASSLKLSDTENNIPLGSYGRRVTKFSCGDSSGSIKSFNTGDFNFDNSLSSIEPSISGNLSEANTANGSTDRKLRKQVMKNTITI